MEMTIFNINLEGLKPILKCRGLENTHNIQCFLKEVRLLLSEENSGLFCNVTKIPQSVALSQF